MPKKKLKLVRKMMDEMGEARLRAMEAKIAHGETQQQLGFFLREAREENGISLRTAAKSLGFSAPFLSDLERGNRPISPETAQRYVELLER